MIITKWPTMTDVEAADQLQLALWWARLPDPIGDIQGSIADRIVERYDWTVDEHQCIVLHMWPTTPNSRNR